MTNYRRISLPGACYFFTVNLERRHGNTLLTDKIDALRGAFQYTRGRLPFEILACVVMPDHLHTVWKLPEGDADFSMRWNLLKGHFSRYLPALEQRSPSRLAKRERGIWQRRFWEHAIRDERDLHMHFDYIHYNPVKHGYTDNPQDWPHSSFLRFVAKGWYDVEWSVPEAVRNMSLE